MKNLLTKILPDSLQDNAERITFLALAGCISLSLVSIAASQILLAVTIAGFVWMWKRNKLSFDSIKPIILPLLAFAIWILIAVLASSNVAISLKITKKFFLFLIVFLVPLMIRAEGRLTWIYRSVFAVSVVSSLFGLLQYLDNPNRDLLHRISGFMSQWMTYSGLLMLVLVLLIAFTLCAGVRKHLWVIPIGVLIVLALMFSQTRNTWIGAIIGIVVLIVLRRPRAITVLILAVLVFYVIAPGQVKQRLASIVDKTDPRFHVYLTAMHIIQDNPWLGVGPKNVQYEAPKYREEKDFPDWLKKVVGFFSNSSKYQEEEKKFPAWLYQHMHNNFFEIAAEVGIPGLILWLWFMIRLAWDALRCYRYANSRSFPGGEGLKREALIASSAALAGWAALMIAGMFEYNFGDSEVLMLFLFIAGAPYAFLAQRPEARRSAPSIAGQ